MKDKEKVTDIVEEIEYGEFKLDDLQDNKMNYSSFWLNGFSFFFPIFGLCKGFSDLLLRPYRARGILVSTFWGLCIQLSILYFLYVFLFPYMNDYIVFIFG